MATTPADLAVILARAAAHDAGDAAVIGTTITGDIVYWNERAESLYGWRTDEALGRNILDVTPTRQTADEAAQILEQLRLGESWHGPFIVQRRDGAPIVVDITDYPVCDAGRIIGVVGLSRRQLGNATLRREL